MVDILQEMHNALSSDVVIVHEFLSHKGKYLYFGFIEGQDDKFLYYDLFKSHFEKDSYFIIKCGGKRAMAAAMTDIENGKADRSVMFIMDGDYNNKIQYSTLYRKYKDDFYILDDYSIENFFCKKEALVEILKREYGMTDDSVDMKTILDDHDRIIAKYEQTLKTINMFFYVLRVLRNDNKTDFSVINNNRLYDKAAKKTVIDISLDKLSTYFNVPPLKKVEINIANNFFKGKNLLSYCRGHNLIAVMRELLHEVHKSNKQNKYSKKYSGIDVADIILNHCTYAAVVPNSLIEFLKRHKIAV